jgi:hypothetical protein
MAMRGPSQEAGMESHIPDPLDTPTAKSRNKKSIGHTVSESAGTRATEAGERRSHEREETSGVDAATRGGTAGTKPGTVYGRPTKQGH